MSERKFKFTPGEYYHIYNRGNSRQEIFLDTHDHARFLKLLYLCNSTKSFKLHLQKGPVYDIVRDEQLVLCGAYCLMPNHFHILVSPKTDSGLSKFIQKLSTGYSMYFNNKYDRTGTLFEGKFKAELVNDDRYLKYLYAYIHLNPMKLYDRNWRMEGVRSLDKAKQFVRNYKYSSFQDYLGLPRKESIILNREAYPKYFQSVYEFEQKIFEWLDEYNPIALD